MELLFNLGNIEQAAKDFLGKDGNASVIAFHGDLGAGKTTFISALCKAKGVKEVTSSPTFSLINDYVFKNKKGKEQHIYHLDLYRIRDEEEAIQAGIEDCLYSGNLCLVEWPEKIAGLLPETTLHVTIIPDKNGRKLIW
jgi:tRNA threonylcarbamoyladenosine biosynthesis protein TsaE